MATKTSTKKSGDLLDEQQVSSVTEEVTEPAPKPAKAIIPKDIDPDQYVVVRNGFQGTLVYRSRRTGEKFRWEEFGDEQEMSLSELKNAKSSNKKFFINNWFMFDEPWIVDYLGMGQYYKYAIKIEDFDNIFTMPADEIKRTIAELSAGQKKSVEYRARVLLQAKEIDSNKTIAALEEALGVELIER